MSYSLKELENLYEKCMQLSPEERQDFIASNAKGNKLLADTLLAMVSEHSRIDDFFNTLQKRVISSFDPDAVLFPEGTIIDKYKISGLIAEGGMGQVYRAERVDGQFDQTVAIKCLSMPLSNKDFMLKFRQEQQILASLQHYNIARLFDGGITDGGVPYIIMEYIDGMPIDKFVENHELSEAGILDLFIQTCHAVQSAHNQFVLHQDIKPGNILIGSVGEVKLLDFGVASIVSETQAQKEFRGTPNYASPEQIQRKELSTATDIYQLGVLLHQLLTGKFPFDKPNRLTINRKINLDPFQLNQELKSIIKKCLRENPAERYQMVSELIADLQAYLNNYPVSTISATINYKAVKYVQRNAVVVGLVALVFLSMAIGTIISVRQATRARQQRNTAIAESQKNERIMDFMLSVFESASPEENFGKEVSVKDILQQSIRQIPQFKDDGVKAQMLGVMGEVAMVSGNHSLADSLLQQAIALNQLYQPDGYLQEQLSNYENLAFIEMNGGDFDNAVNIAGNGIDLAIENNITYTDEYLSLRVMQTIMLAEKGDFNKVDSMLHSIADLMEMYEFSPVAEAKFYNQKAHLYRYQGKVDSAIHNLQKAQQVMLRDYPMTHPFNLALSANLASLYRQANDFDVAIATIKENIRNTRKIFGSDHLRYLKSLNTLGVIYNDVKNFEEATETLEEARHVMLKNKQKNTVAYAITNANLTRAYLGINKIDSALSVAEEAHQLAQKNLPRQSTFYHIINMVLAESENAHGKSIQAEARMEEVLKGFIKTNGPDYVTTVSSAKKLARIYQGNGKYQKADSVMQTFDLKSSEE